MLLAPTEERRVRGVPVGTSACLQAANRKLDATRQQQQFHTQSASYSYNYKYSYKYRDNYSYSYSVVSAGGFNKVSPD